MRNLLASAMLIVTAISIVRLLIGLLLGEGLGSDVYGERIADWLSSRSP